MKKLLFALAYAGALWASACSNGGSTTPPPPPQGKYSTASLNGTYAFMTNGEVITNTGSSNIARVGSFQANGQGVITGGVYDVNVGGAQPATNPITGGSYTVGMDGRGTLTLNINANGQASTINFGIVLTSTSSGMMMDETSTSGQASTGSGDFVKQNTALFQTATVTGTYTFDFSGLDGSAAPVSIVGEFGANSGVITGGFEDVNDGVNGVSNGAISATGSFVADQANMASFGRGTVSTLAGEVYAFYIVDGTRIRMISASNSGNTLSGDAIAQSGVPADASAINGGFAFLIAGSSATAGITRVGSFATTAGAISALHEDTDIGTSNLTADGNTGSIAADSANPGIPGRFLVTINNSGSAAPFTAVVYFSSSILGVMQETSVASNSTVDVADGTIAAQTGSPYSSSNVTGPYAFSWSGQTLQNSSLAEEDFLGQVTSKSLSLSGACDQFELTAGVATKDISASGSVTIGSTSTGRNTMTISVPGQINFVIYFVSPQEAFFANTSTQNTRIVAGILQAQQ